MPSHAAATLVLSFLIGSIPFGYLLFRFTDQKDIRSLGSGNIGATNVLRAKGLPYGLLILLLDCAKGALPMIYAAHHFPQHRPLLALTLLAAVLGHIYTPFLKGKGGKGVATFFGALAVFTPGTSLVFILFFLLTVSLCRYVSAASMSAVSAAFLSVLTSQSAEVSMVVMLSVMIIIVHHRQNIQRILNEKEPRLGKRNCHE